MRELVLSIVRRSLPGLVEAKPLSEGMRGWIERGSFYVDPTSTNDIIELKNINLSNFLPYQAFDYERFALSSWETISDYRTFLPRPKALSWPLLKIYYSGFFAGHALMRAMGHAIIRIEAKQAKYLTQVGRIFCSEDFSVSPGTYDLRAKQTQAQSFTIILRKAPEGGGAHDIFWKRFYAFLGELAVEVATDKDPETNNVIAKISEIQSVLASRGLSNGSWLSAMRNEINYQHLYGVWFPFGAPERDIAHVANLKFKDTATIRLDHDAQKKPIQAFCSGCAFLAALSFEVSEQLVSRAATNNASYVRKWQRLGIELDL